VLEAMAMARPVVATDAAWSGIDAEPERDLLVRDDAAAFAAGVCAVLEDPALGTRLAESGRRQVESRYAWSAQLAKLDGWLGLGAADPKVEAA
jgi:polysaccharide biosynthesis protein PslH